MKNNTHPHKEVTMTGFLVLLMAFGCGLSVASNYYAQPLLELFTHEFGVSTAKAGLLVTLSQLGFSLGVVFIIPLGDILERRRMITFMGIIGTLGLFGMGYAKTFNIFSFIAVIVGFSTSLAQIIVPLSAHLATPNKRGTVVSNVMAGLLIGILLARTFSGIVAEYFGWRAVYYSASIAMGIFTLIFYLKVPKVAPTSNHKYLFLMRSILHLFRDEKTLRVRGLIGALDFASFNVFWTCATFMLVHNYGFTEKTIGFFGLVGAAGALGAQFAGRIADKGHAKISTGFFIITVIIGWVFLYFGQHSLVSFILGLLFFDLGIQGVHISNQSEIYRLNPNARNRLTTGYMAFCFLGAALGSAVSAVFYDSIGWLGICLLGITLTLLCFIIWWKKEVTFPLSTMKRIDHHQ